MDEGEADVVDLSLSPAFGLELGDGFRFLIFVAEVGVVELDEDPLGPLDVAGIGGVDLAVPVVAEAELLELAAEVVGIGLGGDAGVLVRLDGVLLGGESEGVPTHGVEDVETIHALVAADDIGSGVSLRVAYVEALARGVREHVENVVFRLGRIEAFIAGTGSAEGFVLGPVGLPFGLELVEGEGLSFVGHDLAGREAGTSGKNTHKMND